MKLESLKDLYIEQLRDLYSAETQLVEALPKMAKAATHSELKRAFEAHLKQTKRQRADLEKIILDLGAKPDGHTCKAMKGLVEEGAELIEEKKNSDPEVLDAGLIAAAQRVEHYEIAGYGTVRTYAEMLGENEAAAVLDRIAHEEGDTDHKLTKLALEVVNPAAA